MYLFYTKHFEVSLALLLDTAVTVLIYIYHDLTIMVIVLRKNM